MDDKQKEKLIEVLRKGGWADYDVGLVVGAIAVTEAAMRQPKPERKTPGQVFVDGRRSVSPNYSRWEIIHEDEQRSIEAGAAAVLKECAVQPEDVTEEDAGFARDWFEHGGPTLEILQAVIRRIQERKGQ